MMHAKAPYMTTETIAVGATQSKAAPANRIAHKVGGAIAARNPTVVNDGRRFPIAAQTTMIAAARIHTHPSSFSFANSGR